MGESGMVLIPTRFVWPYGGRVVYISGSFTGWTQWPMTPVEGCPDVFQTICSLPPGFHQFKFVVDGKWRHDEHQPFISNNIGTVNTILLIRKSDTRPAKLSPQMPLLCPDPNMDVDNEVLQRVVSDDTSSVPLPMMSETVLEISRHSIAVFLSAHMAYELLPESGKVVAFDVDLPVKQAFHILHEQQIASHGSHLTEEELERHTISDWKEAKLYMNSQLNGFGGSVSRRLVQAQVSSIPIVDDNDSLLDVYSRSDITALAKDKIYTHINPDETTIHQVLQYRDDPFITDGCNNQRCHMCLQSDPFHMALERLSQPGVRRLVIVETGTKRVQGIISLSDVFRFLLGI
ncbi:hypothetical protein OROGR_008907 [Orobanche gracilis]